MAGEGTSPRVRFCLILLAVGICGSLSLFILARTRPADTAKPSNVARTADTARLAARPAKPLPRMTLSPSEPVQVRIPALNMDAPVIAVGRNERGEMEAPAGRDEVGWYKFGYLPGALGNAVLAGHSWHADGRGVFADLVSLKTGDEIEVTTETRKLLFTVTTKQAYPADTDRAAVIFGESPAAQLRLITCAGDWNAAEQRYEQRLVVTASYIRELP